MRSDARPPVRHAISVTAGTWTNTVNTMSNTPLRCVIIPADGIIAVTTGGSMRTVIIVANGT